MTYDVVVGGGGHAGVEAAWSAARMGCSVAMVTMRIEAIGRMSCNPAVGGLGKGQMVREIDAFGGLMGLATDKAGIQFRILNRSRGPAVWAPRAQADRALYSEVVKDMLRGVDGLELIEGQVDSLIVEERGQEAGNWGMGSRAGWPTSSDTGWPTSSEVGDIAPLRIAGVRLQDGRELSCRAMVLATGTFLRGLMHCGEQRTEGGRIGEPAAVKLSESLERIGLTLGRLQTCTTPRIHRDSIDFSKLTPQPGDNPPVPFSFMNKSLNQKQIECWIAHTNAKAHELIRNNVHRTANYSGRAKSRGPRYCPSIEEKVCNFAQRESHQLFLEPEGYDNPWVYCNGLFTFLPADVQEGLLHSIEGLEKAKIVQPGYGIEYDWVPTDQTTSGLESKRVAGLFLAGQINGTSGYEEAAGQGLLAGINAVAKIRDREPLVLGRDEAYIGVLIDDIVTKPPDEPYRMFTSRAEYRLHLRSDNADMRLTPIGRRVGLVDDRRWERFEKKRASMEALEAALVKYRFEGRSLSEWLQRPNVNMQDLLAKIPENSAEHFSPEVLEAVAIHAKYAGYLEREQRLIERYKQLEAKSIPASFDYQSISELRYEAREKFSRVRPRSLGQAARISGISPADIATLSIYLFHRRRKPA